MPTSPIHPWCSTCPEFQKGECAIAPSCRWWKWSAGVAFNPGTEKSDGTSSGFAAQVQVDGKWMPGWLKARARESIGDDGWERVVTVFAYEAQVLRRLRTAGFAHAPAVLRDSGVHVNDEGQTWVSYAMTREPGVEWGVLARESLSPGERRRALFGLAEAIHGLHRTGFSHNDLTPRHILYDRKSGRVSLVGFGASKGPREWRGLSPAHRNHATVEEDRTGTLPYAAPEQRFLRLRELSTAADDYVFGMLFCQALLQGFVVVEETSRVDLVENLHRAGISWTLSRLVAHRLLARRPEDRSGALAAVLRTMASEGWGTLSSPVPKPDLPSLSLPPDSHTISRYRAWCVAAAAGVAAALSLWVADGKFHLFSSRGQTSAAPAQEVPEPPAQPREWVPVRFFTHGVLDEVAPRLSVVVDGKRIQVDCPRGDDPLPTPVLSGDVEKDRKPQEVFWTFSLRTTNTCDECKHGVRIGVESALMGEEESPGVAPRKVLPLPEMKKVKERFRLPSLSCEGDGLDGCQIVWKTPDGRERRMVAGSVVTLPQECVHQAIRIIVRKRGFEDWVSPPVSLCYGQRRVIGVQASDRPLAAEAPAEPPVATPEADGGNSFLWCGQRWETGGRPSVPDEDVRWKPDADGFLQSGGGGAGDAVSWAKMTAVGPCRLVFRCKVQTYYGDFLVTCDGAPLYHYQDASGVDVPWRNASFDIPAGSHEIGFSYHHPGRGYANKMNGVLLDGVKVVPLVP